MIQDNSLIKIIITSTDGSTKTYNLIIDKSKQENNSSLIYLIIIGIETLLLIGLIVFVISKKSR